MRTFPIDSFMKVLFGFGAAMAELFYPPGTNKLEIVDENGKWVSSFLFCVIVLRKYLINTFF